MGVFWVTRAKDNMRYYVCKKRKVSGNIVRDDEITLKTKSSKEHYSPRMRRVVARVEVNGKTVEMVFITNNMDWAASSVCDLYQSRWAIEVFFKQIKQTLQICDFLGHSKQAIR
jgi:IS4 transposase